MRFSLLSLAIHLIYVHGLDVIRNNGNLHIVNKQLSPDGFERPTVLAGVTPNSANFPGPLIIGNKGDHFNLKVINTLNQLSMNQTTSIHWHGLLQKHTNYQDGPSFVTQCPIASNHSYLYDFAVPDQAGTFWYHSHLDVQYCDGLRGALVIYDPRDPQSYLYDIDDETTVITLADWYHPLALQVLAHGAAISNATLINGQGRYPGGPDVGLAVINVQHGKRYRFRLISTSCDPNYFFSIDGHPNLTIIEADGVNTVPVTVNQIQIYAAQRYSFVLNANQPVGNYWIRSVPSVPLAGTPPNNSFANGINSAILRYKGAHNTDPTTSPPSTFAVVASDKIIHPLQNPRAPGKPFPGGADKVINMTIGFTPPGFTINNVSFVSPSVPVLLQILSGAHKAQHLLPAGSVYGLPINKTIEINLIGSSTAVGSPHPFHLHGHTFSVVKTSDSEVFNFQNPVQRDTTPVVAGNTTTIRFVTDNPGPWFLHCHIDFHLAAGLAVVMAEDTDDVRLNDPVPAEWKALCPIYDALKPTQL